MSWRENLVQASFRGVPFETTETGGMAGGRRGPDHEYPGRDVPYAEDLGAITQRYSIEAFVIGDNYIAETERLIEACNMPGPGEFVHPYRGARQVMCRGCEPTYSTREGRMARITLTFTDAGANRNPVDRSDTAAVVRAAGPPVRAAARARFNSGWLLGSNADSIGT